MTMNTDGNVAALKDYMHEQDMDDAKQQVIDDRAAELVEIHTADIDDMVVELVEDSPEEAAPMIAIFLGGRATTEDMLKVRHWFYNTWIPERCKLMAEKELDDE